jgi:hypothetical protein
MSINMKMIGALLFTIMIGIGAIFLLPKEDAKTNTENYLHIGAGDDTSGLLLKQIKKVSESMGNSTVINEKDSDLETIQFKDC